MLNQAVLVIVSLMLENLKFLSNFIYSSSYISILYKHSFYQEYYDKWDVNQLVIVIHISLKLFLVFMTKQIMKAFGLHPPQLRIYND